MGFFSSSTKKTVFANTCHLAEASTEDLQDAVLYSIFSGSSIASSILNVISNRMSTLAENFRTYAKDYYTLGLPTVAYESSTTFTEQDVISAITEDTSRPYGVVLDFHYVAPLVPLMAAAPYLFSVRGWDPDTNVISILPAEYTPTENFSGLFPVKGSIYDVSFNADYTLVTLTYAIVTYTIAYTGSGLYRDEVREPYEKTLSVEYITETQALPGGLYYGRNYCVAAYYMLDSEGSPSDNLYWWYYEVDSKKYATLTPSSTVDTENNLFPVVPLRYKNLSMTRTDVQDTELYITSAALMNKIGIDINEVSSLLEENENVDDIDHAYIVFGVDIQTEVVASIRYLAEFFDQVSDKGQANVFSYIGEMITPSGSKKKAIDITALNKVRYQYGSVFTPTTYATNNVVWSASDGTTTTVDVTVDNSLDDFAEYGLHIEVVYNYIQSEIIKGSIGDIGHATKEFISATKTSSIYSATNNYDDSTVIFRVQIAENSYKQVTVKGLTLINHVCTNHSTVTTLSDVIDDEDEHNLVLPLHYDISKKVPSNIRNTLYQDSLLLVMNSVVVTSVKWYEKSFFKVLVAVVGVVLAVWTGGASTLLTGLTTAVSAGTSAIFMYVLKSVLVSIAISQTLNYVAEWVGPEVMALLSVAVVAIAGFSKLGAFNGIISINFYMPTAGKLLTLASSMLTSASNAYGSLIEDVQESFIAETEKQEALWENLDEYYDLLEEPTESAINLLEAQAYSQTLRQPNMNSPEEFYDLAIHTGNIGTLALQSPTLFHSIALTLPTPDSVLVG